MTISSQLIIYKSYTGKRLSISMRADGMNPGYVTVKVFNTKKPKAEVSVGTGWFSDSRGYGGVSERKLILTDATAVALCRGLLKENTAVAGLIDELATRKTSEYSTRNMVIAGLERWWVLAQQDNPTQFVLDEHRQKRLDDKRFQIGDEVYYCGRYSGEKRGPFTILAERFDWSPVLGGPGWRFSVPGIDAPQDYYQKAPPSLIPVDDSLVPTLTQDAN